MSFEPSVIAFFETQAQLEALLHYRHQSGVTLNLIAVTAEADYAAEKVGLIYQTIEEFYSDSDLMERGITNFDRVQQFCDRYDTLLREELGSWPEVEWISTHYYTFTLKGIFDSLLHRSVAVQALFDTLRPTRVVCFDLSSLTRQEGFDLPHPTLFLTSRLVPLVAQAAGCQIIWLPVIGFNASDGGESKVAFTVRLKELVRQTPLWPLLRWGKRTITTWSSLFRRSGDTGYSVQEGPTLLYGGVLDDADALRVYWSQQEVGQLLRFGEVFHTERPGRGHCLSLKRLWDKVKHDTELRSYFILDGVDLFPLVESNFRFFTLHVMADLLAFAASASRALERVKRGVILMCGSQGTHRVIAKAAHAAGVPIVTQHYGEFFGYSDWPMIEHEDLVEVDYFWCYGPGSERHLQQPSQSAYVRPGTKRARPVAIGSPSLDDLVVKQRSRNSEPEGQAVTAQTSRRVMYVFSCLYGDRRYFSYHMYPDIWYWRLQRDVINTCAVFPDVHLIVKPPPRGRESEYPNPLLDWIVQSGIPNCEVIHDKMFADVLDLADAYIIDIPSTVLLQALTTVKPILVYIDSTWFRFNPEAMALLRKRAIVSETREQFLQDIADFLSRPDWVPPLPLNDEFLCAYGTYLNDGRSVERAAELLVKLAEQSKVATANSECILTSGGEK